MGINDQMREIEWGRLCLMGWVCLCLKSFLQWLKQINCWIQISTKIRQTSLSWTSQIGYFLKLPNMTYHNIFAELSFVRDLWEYNFLTLTSSCYKTFLQFNQPTSIWIFELILRYLLILLVFFHTVLSCDLPMLRLFFLVHVVWSIVWGPIKFNVSVP